MYSFAIFWTPLLLPSSNKKTVAKRKIKATQKNREQRKWGHFCCHKNASTRSIVSIGHWQSERSNSVPFSKPLRKGVFATLLKKVTETVRVLTSSAIFLNKNLKKGRLLPSQGEKLHVDHFFMQKGCLIFFF